MAVGWQDGSMTADPAKSKRPAGELSPAELAEHRRLDAVRTNTCLHCGAVFAVEILKCPECSTVARGSEVGAWTNYSYRTAKAAISNPVPEPSENEGESFIDSEGFEAWRVRRRWRRAKQISPLEAKFLPLVFALRSCFGAVSVLGAYVAFLIGSVYLILKFVWHM